MAENVLIPIKIIKINNIEKNMCDSMSNVNVKMSNDYIKIENSLYIAFRLTILYASA